MGARTVTAACVLLLLAALGAWPWLRGTGGLVEPTAPDTPAERSAQAPERVQVIRCVDEDGKPVRGATVELVRATAGDGYVPTETSDDLGLTTFRNLREGRYEVRARAGHRHHVPTADTTWRTLPDGELDIVLSEPWVGGLELTGARPVHHATMASDFRTSQDEAVEQALVAELQRQHPQALFLAMFRDPTQPPSDTVQVLVDWVGHATHRHDLRMRPASSFGGPELLAPDDVPRRDWTEVRVVLVDAQGRELAPGIRAALEGRIDLLPASTDGGPRDALAALVVSEPMPLPVGEFVVRRYDPGNNRMTDVGRCTVAKDTRELRIVLNLTDRVVHLRLLGAGNDYVLRIVHESGRTLEELAAKEGRHALFLPQGPCTAIVSRLRTDGTGERHEHAFTVTPEPEQHVVWDVPAPK